MQRGKISRMTTAQLKKERHDMAAALGIGESTKVGSPKLLWITAKELSQARKIVALISLITVRNP